MPVEAVLGKAMADGGGAKAAVLRARAALGAELRTLMTSSGSDASGPALKEAAAAWIQARGSPALALQRMMGERRRKVGQGPERVGCDWLLGRKGRGLRMNPERVGSDWLLGKEKVGYGWLMDRKGWGLRAWGLIGCWAGKGGP